MALQTEYEKGIEALRNAAPGGEAREAVIDAIAEAESDEEKAEDEAGGEAVPPNGDEEGRDDGGLRLDFRSLNRF